MIRRMIGKNQSFINIPSELFVKILCQFDVVTLFQVYQVSEMFSSVRKEETRSIRKLLFELTLTLTHTGHWKYIDMYVMD